MRRPDVEDVPLDDDSEGSPPTRRPPAPPPVDGAPERAWASKGITGLLETVGARRFRALKGSSPSVSGGFGRVRACSGGGLGL